MIKPSLGPWFLGKATLKHKDFKKEARRSKPGTKAYKKMYGSKEMPHNNQLTKS